MFRQFILCMAITLAALAGCMSASAGKGASGLALDGTWEGTIENEEQTDILRLRLVIEGERARVWLDGDGTWFEEMPGAFRMSRVKGNAVIHATGKDDDGVGIKSWAIIATPRSPDELLVVSSWVVNNTDMRQGRDFRRYSSHIAGILDRASEGR